MGFLRGWFGGRRLGAGGAGDGNHSKYGNLESAEFSAVSSLLLTSVAGGTRRQQPFYQPPGDFLADSSNFGTIAKFAVTPEGTQNIGISASGFSKERGTLEYGNLRLYLIVV
jgi:hypothetical protein